MYTVFHSVEEIDGGRWPLHGGRCRFASCPRRVGASRRQSSAHLRRQCRCRDHEWAWEGAVHVFACKSKPTIPYATPLATSIACSKLWMGITDTTGPKISSCAMRMFRRAVAGRPSARGNQPLGKARLCPDDSRPSAAFAPIVFSNFHIVDDRFSIAVRLMHGPISVEESKPVANLQRFHAFHKSLDKFLVHALMDR